MERVQARHYEVEREENLRVARVGVLAGMTREGHVLEAKRSAGNVMFFEFVSVLDGLDAKKCETEEHSQAEHDQQ